MESGHHPPAQRGRNGRHEICLESGAVRQKQLDCLCRGHRHRGIGGGLPSRVDAAKLGATKAGELAVGSVLASDVFFPFPDGVEAAAEAGVTAVIQPGGSIRDKKVIARANELGLAMVFTGVRHFRH